MLPLFRRRSVPNPYQLLGISPSCTEGELQAAYRLKAKLYHPDRARDEGDKFRAVKEAYETLKCPLKRAALDRELGIKMQFGGSAIQVELGGISGGTGLARGPRFPLTLWLGFVREARSLFSFLLRKLQGVVHAIRMSPFFQGKIPVPVLVHNETTLSDVLGERVIVRPGVLEAPALQQAVVVCRELMKNVKFVSAKVITVDVVSRESREQRNILLLVPRKVGYQVPVVHSVALRRAARIQEEGQPLKNLVVTWLGDGPFCQTLLGSGTSVYPA